MLRSNTLLLLLVMLASIAVAQSGSYQDGTYVGFKPVAIGSNINPVTGESYEQHAEAYIVQSGSFQYLILKPGDAGVQPMIRSPFSYHRNDRFLDDAQLGSPLHVRIVAQKIYIQEGSKEHAYAILSVVPVAPGQDTERQPTRIVEQAPTRTTAGTGSTDGYRPQFDQCLRESESVPARMLECGATEQAYQDGKLEQTYQQLLAAESPEVQERTRQNQRQWLAQRTRACDPKAGTGDHAIDKPACVLEETKNQVNRLQGQLAAMHP